MLGMEREKKKSHVVDVRGTEEHGRNEALVETGAVGRRVLSWLMDRRHRVRTRGEV